MLTRNPFRGIRPGAVVTWRYTPRGLPAVERRAKVNALLIFDTHVVVSRGACGVVVNAGNYVRHSNPREV